MRMRRRVWAPAGAGPMRRRRAGRSSCVPDPTDPAGGGSDDRPGAGHRLRLPARRRRHPAARPALAAAAGRRARPEPRSTTTPPTTGPDGGWTGRELPGAVIYELHVGTFTPGGTFDAAIERLDHLVDLGVTHVELLPVNAFNGIWNWGYDGVAWYAVHEPYGGPDAPEAVRRRLPRPRARRHARRRLQPPRPERQLPAAIRAVPQDRAATPGATWSTSTARARDRCARYILDNALHVADATSTSTALRLDAVHALHDERPDAPARGAGRRRSTRWPRARPAADADRRVRPQRPDA